MHVPMVAEPTIDRHMVAEISQLKRERRAIILAHNYQYGAIQDIADVVGDSLGLSQAAAHTDAEVILFCGVHFMAETAAILCPDKRVLLPDLAAGCSLADSITAEQLRAWKAEHPGAVVVSYINTTAEVKAESDYCCTSGNAVKVVQSIPPDREILFLPDMFLGSYVHHITGRPIKTWAGECHVHAAITPDIINRVQADHPAADLVIHPECGCVTACMQAVASGDLKPNGHGPHILSTEGMMRHAQQSDANEFVIATEVGVLHRLRKANPTRHFHPISDEPVCRYMKMITPEKVLHSLREMEYQVTVPADLSARARGAIERMLELA
jgi:quinolinate synthase